MEQTEKVIRLKELQAILTEAWHMVRVLEVEQDEDYSTYCEMGNKINYSIVKATDIRKRLEQ